MTAIFEMTFQMHFVERKCFVPTRRQAIIYTNDGIPTDAYMRHSACEIIWNDMSKI